MPKQIPTTRLLFSASWVVRIKLTHYWNSDVVDRVVSEYADCFR
jgi:hypothetical protein